LHQGVAGLKPSTLTILELLPLAPGESHSHFGGQA
jgi:hypothetical protein